MKLEVDLYFPRVQVVVQSRVISPGNDLFAHLMRFVEHVNSGVWIRLIEDYLMMSVSFKENR